MAQLETDLARKLKEHGDGLIALTSSIDSAFSIGVVAVVLEPAGQIPRAQNCGSNILG